MYRCILFSSSPLPSLSSECNAACKCLTELYEPVCDTVSGVQYFSPCHAGCQSYNKEGMVCNLFMLFSLLLKTIIFSIMYLSCYCCLVIDEASSVSFKSSYVTFIHRHSSCIPGST